MKPIPLSSQVFLFASVLLLTGCGRPASVAEPKPKPKQVISAANTSVYAAYAPEKVEILPLTEFVGLDGSQRAPKINIYVSLLDSFGSQGKSPGTFRFELYEHVQRSAEPKGQRLAVWPDIDLTDAARNNGYWRDFLRAYEFKLDCEPQTKSHILQATFLCPTGKRLSAEFALRPSK